MWLKFTILYVLLFVRNVISAEIGDKCVPNEEISDGSCKLINDCKVAVRAIKQNFYHPFQRCGFREIMEIVCCPNDGYVLPEPTKAEFDPTENKIQTTTPSLNKKSGEDHQKRIAEIECQKIFESRGPPLDLHITGGVSTSLGEFPHMVALGYKRSEGYQFQCGGSLISDTFIITAAHCVDTLDTIKPTIARMGVIHIGENKFNSETDVRIAEIIVHPNSTKRSKYHDLALIRLEKPVKFNESVSPICLYTSQSNPSIDLMVTGWGKTGTYIEERSNILLKAKVTAVHTSKCNESYFEFVTRRLSFGITEGQICAGDKEGLRDTCQGDSGGPLQGLTGSDGMYRLVGVTSFGRGCGSSVPGVYTRVSHYLDWIESVVWPK